MEWKLLLCGLSLSMKSFESMAISSSLFFSFFKTFMGPFFFKDLHGSILFLIAHASLFFNKNSGERPTHIVEHLFCGMSGWYNANFSKKHSKGVCGVHMNLDHESMKRILSRVTTI